MIPTEYPTPLGTHRAVTTIQRSRFIATVAPAPTAEAAKAVVASVRGEFSDATHHCWAFVAGPPGSTARIGLSDDGEPHGTAGRPMLNVLLHAPVGDIVAVSTRYYGGVKLGTGGLSRAYAESVSQVLHTLPTKRKTHRVRVELVVAYEHVDPVQRFVASRDVRVADVIYDAEVRFVLLVPVVVLTEFSSFIVNQTRGRSSLVHRDE